MQVLNVRIHQHEEHLFELSIDNLSREDANEKEKAIADTLERFLADLGEKLMKPESVDRWKISGTRYAEQGVQVDGKATT